MDIPTVGLLAPRLWPKFILCRRHSRTESHSILNPTGTGLCRFIQYTRTSTLATPGLCPSSNKCTKYNPLCSYMVFWSLLEPNSRYTAFTRMKQICNQCRRKQRNTYFLLSSVFSLSLVDFKKIKPKLLYYPETVTK
jgi:hypothetical protein